MKIYQLFVLLLIVLFYSDKTFATPVYTAKTGQTTINISGDDGTYQNGADVPNPRFTDNGDGTITDNLTELVWLQNANCYAVQNWTAALSLAEGLNSGECGLTDGSIEGDWRLPNINELRSLISYQYSNPALTNSVGDGQWIQGDPFLDVQLNYYWSSTTRSYDTTWAFAQWIITGDFNFEPKSSSYFIWPVRGGITETLYYMDVNVTGNGTGTVTSPGIDCGEDCLEPYSSGTDVNLTATPAAGSSFVGWTGDCDINGDVTMDDNKTCSAEFSLNQYTLAITKEGNGDGTIMSTPSGIDCGADCSESYYYGTTVTLDVVMPTDYRIVWSNCPINESQITILSDIDCIASIKKKDVLFLIIPAIFGHLSRE